MVETAYRIDDRPTVVRYPRANAYGAAVLRDLFGTDLVRGELPARGTALPVGKGRLIRTARAGAAYTACLLTIGTRLHDAVLAARTLEALHADLGVTVADARFMKPLDTELVAALAASHDVLVTAEEGSRGGFGDHVLQYLCEAGLLDGGRLRARTMTIPDVWIEQGPQKDEYDIAGLNAEHMVARVAALVQGLRDQAEQRHAASHGSSSREQEERGGVSAQQGATAGVFLANAPFQQAAAL